MTAGTGPGTIAESGRATAAYAALMRVASSMSMRTP
jgi:hypothetical protein